MFAVDMPLSPQTVTEFLWTRNHSDLILVLDLPDPMKVVSDDPDLRFELKKLPALGSDKVKLIVRRA